MSSLQDGSPFIRFGQQSRLRFGRRRIRFGGDGCKSSDVWIFLSGTFFLPIKNFLFFCLQESQNANHLTDAFTAMYKKKSTQPVVPTNDGELIDISSDEDESENGGELSKKTGEGNSKFDHSDVISNCLHFQLWSVTSKV